MTPPAAYRATPAAPHPGVLSRVGGFVMGGLVASIVLRALGLSGDWGIGLLDVLLLLGAGYLLFASWRERSAAVEPIVIGTRKPS